MPGRGRGSAIPVVVAVGILLASPGQASAEWQIKPFVGLTFAGGTTIVDPEYRGEAAARRHRVFGVTGIQLGEMFGVEGDFSVAPGFFTGDRGLVLSSRVSTLTGSFVVAWPRRLAAYTLRPYLVAGVGTMHVRWDPKLLDAIRVDDRLTTINMGGGATGFLSDHVGVSWDLRHFNGYGADPEPGSTFGVAPRLSFWRANMALAVRF